MTPHPGVISEAFPGQFWGLYGASMEPLWVISETFSFGGDRIDR
ncbi:MAG: hypothetical protein AAFO06_03945 [Cyanobacteria bacterium J06597_16]